MTPDQQAAKERVDSYIEYTPLPCFCGHEDGWQRSFTERCGFTVTIRVCDLCGTVRQDPAPTEESLTRLYSSGDYRALYSPGGAAQLHAQKIEWGRQQARIFRAHGIERFGTVVDVGCGTGGLLAGMAHMADKLLGVDIGEDFLSQDVPSNVELRVGSAGDLGLYSADLVIACHTLEHYRDVNSAVRDHMRLVRPPCDAVPTGGMFEAILPTVSHVPQAYMSKMSAYLQMPHIWMFTDRSAHHLFQSLGYSALSSYQGNVLVRYSEQHQDSEPPADEAPRVIAEIHEYLRRDRNADAMGRWL